MRQPTFPFLLSTSLPLLLAVTAPTTFAAGLGLGQSDFGGIGLMQTPTARMGELGHFSANWSRTAPYRRYSVFVQPTDWLEAGFRYVSVENRLFGQRIAGERGGGQIGHQLNRVIHANIPPYSAFLYPMPPLYV